MKLPVIGKSLRDGNFISDNMILIGFGISMDNFDIEEPHKRTSFDFIILQMNHIYRKT